ESLPTPRRFRRAEESRSVRVSNIGASRYAHGTRRKHSLFQVGPVCDWPRRASATEPAPKFRRITRVLTPNQPQFCLTRPATPHPSLANFLPHLTVGGRRHTRGMRGFGEVYLLAVG